MWKYPREDERSTVCANTCICVYPKALHNTDLNWRGDFILRSSLSFPRYQCRNFCRYKAVSMTSVCLLRCSLHSGCSAPFLVTVVCSILCPGFSMQSEYSYGGDSIFGPYSAASTVLEIITAMQTPGKVS